ncbi:GNAT family N-acetyltransferase [Demequina sp. NBRC 110057]|uniref:GNAT family N-acetyltransferase n=1 Tax=Demequina sp. NBRC 110057 TaxID=1570346 RepID=UPI0009FD9ADF|nr:GNAT family N-acetyltransferase [Demequina sp. NBRC 110057]
MSPAWQIPPRLETARLTIRAYEPSDAAALHALVLANVGRLRPFIPWAAREPLTLDERRALLEDYANSFAAGENFRFAIQERASGEMIGGVSLHTRVGPDALEIGYWIGAEHEGGGLVSEAVSAVSREALEAGAARVEIWCTPQNSRSAAVAARCGFTFDGERVRDGLALSVWILAA